MAKEILIANSNKADQEEFQRIFETTDYRLIFSESGEEALLRVKLFKPDLIIAAGRSSKRTVWSFVSHQDSESKHIPFILLSIFLVKFQKRTVNASRQMESSPSLSMRVRSSIWCST